MCLLRDVVALKAHTHWGLGACRELLANLGGLSEARDYYDFRMKQARQYEVELMAASKNRPSSEWWMADFYSHNNSLLD